MLASLTLLVSSLLPPCQEIRPYPLDLTGHPDAPQEEEKIQTLVGSGDDLFVSLSGAIGPAGQRVLVFRKVGEEWQPRATLWPSTEIDGDFVQVIAFGDQMAIEGDLALVRASYVGGVAPLLSGTIHVYRRRDGDWEPAGFVGEAVGRLGFGSSLALRNGTVPG